MSERPLPVRIPLHALQVQGLGVLGQQVETARGHLNLYVSAILEGHGVSGQVRWHVEGEELVIDP